ncbi:MAG: hypothetical protein JWM68_3161 [Verrucomicrobiales bacterium]|nr:hypothetical protein [Verrucomicrobiales bacterium]
MDFQSEERKYGEGVIPLLLGASIFWAIVITAGLLLTH